MNLKQAMNTPVSDYENLNVCIWARAVSYEGTQPRFSLDSEALIQIGKPDGFEEFYHLFEVSCLHSAGLTDLQIVAMVHYFYRMAAPIPSPF